MVGNRTHGCRPVAGGRDRESTPDDPALEFTIYRVAPERPLDLSPAVQTR